MSSLQEFYRRIILANELDNNVRAAYRFSDPDGILTGKSGWSFAISQLDINNNPLSILCLRECGFTTDEISGLKRQTIADMRPMHNKLLANCTIVDRYDDQQFNECLKVPATLCSASGIQLTTGGHLALADYHNQFYMSRGGKCHAWAKSVGHPITAQDVYKFKLSLPWGKKRKDDVDRRHNNIVSILKEAA